MIVVFLRFQQPLIARSGIGSWYVYVYISQQFISKEHLNVTRLKLNFFVNGYKYIFDGYECVHTNSFMPLAWLTHTTA